MSEALQTARAALPILTAAVLALLLAWSSPLAALAEETPSTLAVELVDITSNAAVRGIVRIAGPLSTTQSTGADGSFELRDAPAGDYTIQATAPGYKSSDTVHVTVGAGERSVVRIQLAKRESALQSIGRTSTTRARPRPYAAVTRDAPLAHLAESLQDAVGNIPGVALDAASGFGERQGLFGLEGHDPSQTAVTLDGVPLNTPGNAFDASLLGGDLISSASVSFGPANGFSAGSVDFRTAFPTRYPVMELVGRAGPNGTSGVSLLARGSAGALGYVAGRSGTFADLATAGRTFVDWSGADVAHRGGSAGRTGLVKLQFLAGRNDVISGTFIETNRAYTPFCPFDTTLAPCSFGDSASGRTNSTIALANLIGQRGRLSYTAAVFRTAVTSEVNLSSRIVAGAPFPGGSSVAATSGGVYLRTGLDLDPRDRLSASWLESSTGGRLMQSSPYASFAQDGVARTGLLDVALTRALSQAVGVGVGVTERRGLGESASSIGARGDLRIDANSALAAALDIGSGAGRPAVAGLTSSPDLLNYVCDGPFAFGRAGTIVSGKNETSTERLVYTRTTPSATLTLTAFDQLARNVPVRYPLNGSVFADSPLFGLFVAQADVFEHRATVCPGAPALTADDVYLFGLVNDIDTRYTGLRAVGSFTRGAFRFDPFVSVLRARLSSSAAFVVSPQSILRPGMQLLGVPYVQAGGIADYKHGPLELAANYRYYSANNALQARAFGTLDLGMVFTGKAGSVTARVTNLTGAHASTFAVAGDVLGSTAAGTPVPLVGRPFSGPRLSVEYTTNLGVAERGATGARLLAGGPQATPAPATGLPSGPVTAPLEIRNTAPSCTFEVARRAEELVAPLRAYYDARAKNRTAGSMPPPVLTGTSVAYHDVPSGYELEYAVRTPATLGLVFNCLKYRTVDENELAAAGLVGSATSYTGIPLLFSSAYGFLVPTTKERHPPPQYYTAGQGIPRDPYALTNAPSCTANYRGRATVLLGTIQSELARRGLEKPFSTEEFDLRVGTQDSLPWVYVLFKSQFDLAALLNCAHVSQGSQAELAAIRLGGATLPYLSFSPTYGFFFLRR